jgi:hypothetical protein
MRSSLCVMESSVAHAGLLALISFGDPLHALFQREPGLGADNQKIKRVRHRPFDGGEITLTHTAQHHVGQQQSGRRSACEADVQPHRSGAGIAQKRPG